MIIKNISLEEIERRVNWLKSNPTESEVIFKHRLIKKKINFHFQYPIDTPTSWFIADFYIKSINTIIEIDGSIHNLKERQEYDKNRDLFLRKKGYKVVHVKNEDVKTFDIDSLFQKSKPAPKKKYTLAQKLHDKKTMTKEQFRNKYPKPCSKT